ncbi:hypothetical protein [Paludisphaera sp.]|uniref:hypothetical protein n=1 Tax=Paludisphaera sp. TaxID=2017432 RepID=UPI00301CC8BD
MSTIEEIERAITSLPPEQLAEFRAWFAAFDNEARARDFEADVQPRRLDGTAEEALRNLDEGRCADL